MQFKFAFITTALFVSASPAMSATISWFEGANCNGVFINTLNTETAGCTSLGGSAKSVSYMDTTSIAFFVTGGEHDQCSNGPQLTLSESGCSTAPDGYNWESVAITV